MSPTSAGRDSNPGRSGTFGGEITVCSLSRATTSRPRPPASRLTNLPTVPPILMQIVNRFLENSFKIWMFFSPNSILEKCPLVKQYILILNLYFLTYKSTAPIVKCKFLVPIPGTGACPGDYLEPAHVPGITRILQTVLVALQEEFQEKPVRKSTGTINCCTN